jgi:hypothetical protein
MVWLLTLNSAKFHQWIGECGPPTVGFVDSKSAVSLRTRGPKFLCLVAVKHHLRNLLYQFFVLLIVELRVQLQGVLQKKKRKASHRLFQRKLTSPCRLSVYWGLAR